MTLLFITQKMHEQDAFTILWIRAFMARGYTVKVICLEDRVSPMDFEIYSLGKEKGAGKFSQVLRFFKLIRTLKYDRVFVHMTPIWSAMGAPYWILTRTPVYLWYTHYKHSVSMRISGFYVKRMFCATPQSLPRYDRSPRKVVVGHGIDLTIWPKRQNECKDMKHLLAVHRLSRSKRLELGIRALTHLSAEYTLTVYGIEAEPDYVAELKDLVKELQLQDRVIFKGTVPMQELAAIYTKHELMINMASETIDKTMIEAMTCGCFPITTKRNAEAIGMRWAPKAETPEAIAAFIRKFPGVSIDELYAVAEHHSLPGLMAKMDEFIREGN